MNKLKYFLDKFIYAAHGVCLAVASEVNMKIHLAVAIIVVLLGFAMRLPLWKWAALIMVISLVIIAEMFNTAIETTVDMYSESYHPMAKRAKDVAAGAVLLAALTAVIMGVVIFFL